MKEVDLDQHIPLEIVQQKEETDNTSITESDQSTISVQPDLSITTDQSQSPPITNTNHSRNSSINSINKTRITPSDLYNDYPPASPITHASVSPTNSTELGRQNSVHWIIRNQESTSPQSSPSATPQNATSPVIGFAMPTPYISQSDTTSSSVPQSPSLPHFSSDLSPPVYNSSLPYKHATASQSSPYLQTSPPVSSPYLQTIPSASSPYLHTSASASSPYLHTSASASSSYLHTSSSASPHSGRRPGFYPQHSPYVHSAAAQSPPYLHSSVAHSSPYLSSSPQHHHSLPLHSENYHQSYGPPPIPPRPVSPNTFPQDGPRPETSFYHQSNNSGHIEFPMPQHSGEYPSMPMYQDYKPNYNHATAYH
ncbi:hypothetical protein BD560DRAFT_400732 [Blakeslea trispora]|nr:hypothetical protein BD560DRAFT_400732 [Blakeslea trispora]